MTTRFSRWQTWQPYWNYDKSEFHWGPTISSVQCNVVKTLCGCDKLIISVQENSKILKMFTKAAILDFRSVQISCWTMICKSCPVKLWKLCVYMSGFGCNEEVIIVFRKWPLWQPSWILNWFKFHWRQSTSHAQYNMNFCSGLNGDACHGSHIGYLMTQIVTIIGEHESITKF